MFCLVGRQPELIDHVAHVSLLESDSLLLVSDDLFGAGLDVLCTGEQIGMFLVGIELLVDQLIGRFDVFGGAVRDVVLDLQFGARKVFVCFVFFGHGLGTGRDAVHVGLHEVSLVVHSEKSGIGGQLVGILGDDLVFPVFRVDVVLGFAIARQAFAFARA